ncbi:type VII secretion protein EssA [Lentibacillus sp. L22]|nr:type VII secretion protein EssA [Lentibacillus daqui]
MLLRRTKLLFLCICCFLLMLPVTASAEDDSKNKGQIQWKIDRIIQGDNEGLERNTETEQEKRLPDLFKEETKNKITSKQKDQKESMEDLEHSLFTMDMEPDTTVKQVKQSLFTADYTAPKAEKHNDQEEESQSWFNNMLFIVLAGLACILFGGVFIMMRKLTD